MDPNCVCGVPCEVVDRVRNRLVPYFGGRVRWLLPKGGSMDRLPPEQVEQVLLDQIDCGPERLADIREGAQLSKEELRAFTRHCRFRSNGHG
jgi:hypothetical protein